MADLLLPLLRGSVLDVLWDLQRLEVLPAAQQGGVVDQSVQELPTSTDPATAAGSGWSAHLNPWKHDEDTQV